MGAAAADRAKKPRAKEMFSDSDSDSDASGEDSDRDSGRRARAPKSREPSNVVGEADALTINAKYAARFEHNKRREETQRLQEKVKREYILRPGDEDEDSDDESSSSESDEGDLPERFDEQFAKALVRIKRKDPEIYKPDVELFSDVSESSSEDGSASSSDDDDAKEKKKKKTSKRPKKETLREVTARQLLEGGARAFEEDEDAPAKPSGKSYVEEQADLKNAFKAAAASSESDSDDDSDSDSDRGGLKVKRRAEKPDDASAADSKTALGEFFGGEAATKEDAFLRDYLLNQKWKEDETKLPKHGATGYGSSSEEEVEEAEKFEQKYNFRFEEPDGGVIVSHARVVEGTVRKEKTARRDARAARKERKMSEKERLKAEVRRLKNLKREEIQAKMRQIASVGGLAGADAVAAANLDAEFDPVAHDEMMSAMYGDEYYDGAVLGEDGEALEKPEFGNLDEEVRELMGDATEEDGGAAEESATFQKVRAALAATTTGRVDDGGDDIDDGSDEDEDEGADGADGADGAEEAPNAGNKFSKRAAKRWKKELMAKMDEYYKLDAEDFIEDVPCRFKYKEVAPSMYGLSTKDILSMTDKQLTQIVPLKKLAPYRHDADAGMDAKTKARSQRMAREFLTEAAKSKAERRKGKKGKKKSGKDDDDDADDDANAEARAAEERKASYGARAWGKHNLNKKRKEPEGGGGDDAPKSGGAPEPAAEPAAPPKPGQGKNAKKNLKKRQKRNELERAKAAGML